MNRYTIDGDWKLAYWDEQADPQGKTALIIPAQVPGNVELDLMRAGVLPDVFFGENIRLLRPYEFYAWQYALSFDAPTFDPENHAFLCFEGVDCDAEYYLNGELFAATDNALIAHRFDVTDLIKPEANELIVRIHSPLLTAARRVTDGGANESHLRINHESLRMRKAPSQYGWDIMPRALSAGLWREVALEIEMPNEIEWLYLSAYEVSGQSATISCAFAAKTDAPHYEGLSFELIGSIGGEQKFRVSRPLTFPAGRFDFTIDQPALWMPRGYGDPNLYDINARLLVHGQPVAEYKTTLGVRKVELIRSEITDGVNGEFVFLVNGVKVFCKGSNWVPADAFHSRDRERYQEMIALVLDTHCNMLRCWGGNVYEDHAFFDLCDRHGIMVWQDFAMACGVYPTDEAFLEVMRVEAESVVKKLRNHPSIVLWSGDNECDQLTAPMGIDPANNRITREVLPRVIARMDPYRPYLPSSPYISPTVWASGDMRSVPEDHLWGPRDYFKSVFYTTSHAHFVSECGYHGCNSLSSIKTFISEDALWPWRDNAEWLAHAFEPLGPDGPYAYRIELMAKQIEALFGQPAENLNDFILASQISQAEAKKFFIETARTMRWKRTGILWWNIIDGWPQFSDAVVSYDFIKKLAYYYIKRSQQDVCLMLDEPKDGQMRLVAANDTLHDARGTFRVWDGETGEELIFGEFFAPANQSTGIGSIAGVNETQRLLLIEWNLGGGARGVNHYTQGRPPYSLGRFKQWLNKIAALDGSFAAEEIGR